ncbi:MAG TPA: bifunctional diaminohydroxyphosphoribosylaminopyrimidine deaminase/5-amino-6-(5-phosphoribosylamino)uracil reductase RibD [Candidatus Omnitrophota bacterium]|nr:bifunctional diaminohydroxyphosphoribosylaminopyrimidine deaminase/5-amino-6-(5-phosphoribosylamino)uracil reductase RibD [Candidatus Omnitrophota bacterium]
MKSTDIDYMKQALTLALKSKGETSPNPLVGAVVVRNKKIISEGWHRACGGDHAEVIALKKAGAKAQGAKLYVTLEPCSHTGRTPPCVEKIIAAGIQEVIVGMVDPNPVNNGKSISKLKRAGIRVKVGFLENELNKINEPFLKYITKKLPFVTAKCAQTLDGKIATASGESKWITSQETRDYAHRLRSDFDGILVGINTVLKDNPFLNAKKKIKPIKKIIVDSNLRLPLKANLFKNTNPSDIVVATTKTAPKNKFDQLRKKGVNLIVCPRVSGTEKRIQLRFLFKELARREITSILIEGGGRVIGGALQEKLVDKFLIFVAPKIVGDQDALSSVRGLGINRINRLIKLRGLTVKRISEDILIEGYVYRSY